MYLTVLSYTITHKSLSLNRYYLPREYIRWIYPIDIC